MVAGETTNVTMMYSSHRLAALMTPRVPIIAPLLTAELAEAAGGVLQEAALPYGLDRHEPRMESPATGLSIVCYDIIIPGRPGTFQASQARTRAVADRARAQAITKWEGEILPSLRERKRHMTDQEFSIRVGALMIHRPTPKPEPPSPPARSKRVA